MIKVHIRKKRKQDRAYWCYYSIQGKQFHKNLDTPIKSKAMERAKEIERQLAISTEGHESRGNAQIGDFLNRYWDYAKSHKRPATLEIEKSAVRHLLHVLGNKKNLRDITPTIVEKMKSERLRAGDSPSSVNIYLRHVSAILGRAVKWGGTGSESLLQSREIESGEEDSAFSFE